jgi:hypothetical protein
MDTQNTADRPTLRVMGTPIVLERPAGAGKNKSNKPRLKEADRIERNVYRAAQRTMKAADKGMRRYDKARRTSAARVRDGALVELIPNLTRAMVASTTRLAPVPLDLLRAASVRRVTRRSVQVAVKILDKS